MEFLEKKSFEKIEWDTIIEKEIHEMQFERNTTRDNAC